LTIQEEVMLKFMLERLRDARLEELDGEGAGEAGFTLIELMVVLLIIAILLAIAIPTFLGVTSGANDRATQSNLTNAVTEAAAIYQNGNQVYPNVVGGYTAAAPEFSWSYQGNCSKTTPNCISVETSTDQNILLLAAYSPAANGKCWFVLVSPNEAPTSWAQASTPATLTAPTSAGTYYDWAAPSSGNCNVTNVGSGWAHWSATYGAAAGTTGS
jgi:type IV pilus assembly protein PilA